MILPGTELQVLVATKPVDFRKQADTLAAFVQEALAADPFSGHLFVFRGRKASQTTFSIPIAICHCRIPVAPAARRTITLVSTNET